MGESLSKAVQPEELAVFKKLPDGPLTQFEINIPELPHNRRATDRSYLIVFFVIILLLMPFLIYTLVNADIDRFMGYDPCGNVCGKKNYQYDQYACSGKNYTLEKYLQYDADLVPGEDGELVTPRHCVKECNSGYKPIFGRCMKIRSNSKYDISDREIEVLEEEGVEIAAYLRKNAWKITLACFLSLGVAILMLFLFRTATAAVVWGILGGVLLFGAVLVGAMWYWYFNLDSLSGDTEKTNGAKQGLLIIGIVFTIMWLVLLCVLAFMYNKIKLVIQLLKEATKAAFDMPMLIFVPVLSFFVELIILIALGLTSVYMFSSGVLSPFINDYLYYKQNAVIVFTLIFNFWTAFWATQFVIGIQYMVIAGAVSKWYFARDKNNLGSPILSSSSIVFKFHLGSVALGSMIITIMAIVRSLISSLAKNKSLKVCVDSCMKSIESFIKYLSKNSYILTAMHGKPFYKSGKRAAKIIFQNAVNIVAINYIGDFVLGMAQLLIVLISMLITAALLQGGDDPQALIIYVIVFFVSLIVAITSFSVFETCIDTIFLCFCEDSLLNDGMARPYAMSRNLMEFVENSKKVYGENKN